MFDIENTLPIPQVYFFSQKYSVVAYNSNFLSCISDLPILLFLQEKNSQKPNN